MYATLTAAALVLAAAQPPDTGRPGQPGSTPGIGQPGTTTGGPMIDGNWTVVALEKNGQPVTDAARTMTVSIRGNVATFNRTGSAAAGGTTGVQPAGGTGTTAGAGGSSEMRAMRLEFGTGGTIRVMEAGADGKFGAGTPGTPGTTGTPGAGTPGSSPGLGAQSGVRTGVYVLTQDYLAVSIQDTGTAAGQTGGTGTTLPGTGTPRPGTTGTDRDRPRSDRPGAGTNTQPGGTAGAAQPGGGTTVVGDGRLPAQRSYVTVILRRDTGSRPGATGGGTTGTPGLDR